MAAEAGAEFSGMEFTTYYTVAPVRSTMTRSMSYAFATYYDEDGAVVPMPPGPETTRPLARAMLRAGSSAISPGHRKTSASAFRRSRRTSCCRSGVGYRPLQGPVRSDPAWGGHHPRYRRAANCRRRLQHLGSRPFCGRRCGHARVGRRRDFGRRHRSIGLGGFVRPMGRDWAARHASANGSASGGRAIGQAGLRPASAPRDVDLSATLSLVQGEMLPYDKNIFRSGQALKRSAETLDAAWAEVDAGAHGAGGNCCEHEKPPRCWRRRAGVSRRHWRATRPRITSATTGRRPTPASTSAFSSAAWIGNDKAGLRPSIGTRIMIELVIAERCTGCDACVEACPTNVLDPVPGGPPVIARQEDCQTCFMCELYCRGAMRSMSRLTAKTPLRWTRRRSWRPGQRISPQSWLGRMGG